MKNNSPSELIKSATKKTFFEKSKFVQILIFGGVLIYCLCGAIDDLKVKTLFSIPFAIYFIILAFDSYKLTYDEEYRRKRDLEYKKQKDALQENDKRTIGGGIILLILSIIVLILATIIFWIAPICLFLLLALITPSSFLQSAFSSEYIKTQHIKRNIVLIIFTATCFYYKLQYPSYTYRYKMTVEVETPQGLKSGSSVIQVHTNVWADYNYFNGSRKDIKGEGVFIKMTPDKTLFILRGNIDGTIKAEDFMAYAFPPPNFKVDENNHPIGKESDYGMTYPVYIGDTYGMKYYGTLKNAKGVLPYDTSSFESRVSKFSLNFNRGFNYLFAKEPAYKKVLRGENISKEEAIKLLVELKNGIVEIVKSENKRSHSNYDVPFQNIDQNINEEDLLFLLKKELIRDRKMISGAMFPVFRGGTESVPAMAVVTENGDDVKIEIINPHNLSRIFGDGVALKQIIIETTNDSITQDMKELPAYIKAQKYLHKLREEKNIKRDFSGDPLLSLEF